MLRERRSGSKRLVPLIFLLMTLATAAKATGECKDNSGQSKDPKNCQASSSSDGKTQLMPISIPNSSGSGGSSGNSSDSTSSKSPSITRDNLSPWAQADPSEDPGGSTVGGGRCSSGDCRGRDLSVATAPADSQPADWSTTYDAPAAQTPERSSSAQAVVEKPAVAEGSGAQGASPDSSGRIAASGAATANANAPSPSWTSRPSVNAVDGSWLSQSPPALKPSAYQCELLGADCAQP